MSEIFFIGSKTTYDNKEDALKALREFMDKYDIYENVLDVWKIETFDD